jgi:hypothetical protein
LKIYQPRKKQTGNQPAQSGLGQHGIYQKSQKYETGQKKKQAEMQILLFRHFIYLPSFADKSSSHREFSKLFLFRQFFVFSENSKCKFFDSVQ